MKKYYIAVPAAVFVILMLIFPDICRSGAAKGLALCGGVVIPSLFPFTVCALIIMRSRAVNILQKAFGRYGGCIAVFLLSLLGGYPLGAKLVNELYSSGGLSKKDSGLMLCCCVNAGPAFIVIAIGSGAFGSKTAGYILLISHIISAAAIAAVIFSFITPKKNIIHQQNSENIFVETVSDSAASMLSVSAFIIFFSAVTSFLNKAAADFPILKLIASLCEVTSGAAQTGNLYITAFLLGFAGFSVWLQVSAASGYIGFSPLFIPLRFIHGILGAFLSAILCNFFGISIQTLGNRINFTAVPYAENAAGAIALGIMLSMLILTLCGKNNSGKITDNLL